MPFSLFTNRTKYQQKVADLLGTCESAASVSHEEFAQRSDLVAAADSQRWDTLMTVAAVAIATREVEQTLREKDFKLFYETVQERLGAWHSRAPVMLEHLFGFVMERSNFNESFEEAVGTWVLSNVKGAEPTPEQLAVAPRLGAYLRNQLENWWNRL